MTAATRKSIGELTRRRARTIFTVLTLALAVASVGIFAIPALMADALEDDAAASRLPDVVLSMSPVELTAGDLDALEALPNVAAVEPRARFITRVWVGERRERAVVEGVPDYANQTADIVTIESGVAPGNGEALTDRNNSARHSFGLDEGESVRLVTAGGGEQTLRISGVGRDMATGENDPSNDWITFYTTAQGTCPYENFLATLKDKKAKQQLISRLARIEHSGHLGDFKNIEGTIIELRIHYGEGYRIYCAQRGQELMIILTAGSKSTQDKDIQKAKKHWNEYQQRQNP